MKKNKYFFILIMMFAIILAGVLGACEDMPSNITIKFMLDKDTEYVSVKIVNGKITLPENPTKEGFTFDGWFSDLSLEKAFDENAIFNSEIKVYAKFTKNVVPPVKVTEFKVKFMANATTIYIEKETINNIVTAPSVPTTEIGYEFLGWYTDVELTTQFDFATKLTAPITLYPKITKKLSNPEKFINALKNSLHAVVDGRVASSINWVNDGSPEYQAVCQSLKYEGFLLKNGQGYCGTESVFSATNIRRNISTIKLVNGKLLSYEYTSSSAYKIEVDEYYWQNITENTFSVLFSLYDSLKGDFSKIDNLSMADIGGIDCTVNYSEQGSKLIVTVSNSAVQEIIFSVENGYFVDIIHDFESIPVKEIIEYDTKTEADLKFAEGTTEETYKKEYVVNFMHPSISSKSIITNDCKISNKTIILEAGYELLGWYTDVELTKQFDFNTIITANMKLYPKIGMTMSNEDYFFASLQNTMRKIDEGCFSSVTQLEYTGSVTLKNEAFLLPDGQCYFSANATFNGETNNTFTMVKNINGALMAFQNDSNTAQKFQVDQYFWKKASGASYIMTMYKENDGLIEICNKDSFGKTTQLSYKKDGSKLIVTTTDTEHSEGNGWEFIVENGLLVCFKMPYIDQTGTGYVVENIMYNAKTAQDLKFAVGKTENDYTLATNQVRVSVELVIGDGQNASYIVGKRQLLCDRGTLLSGIKVTDLSEEQTYTSCQNPLTKDLETYFTFEGKYYDKQLTVPADGAKVLYDEQQIYWKVTLKTD
ncbi:MAG: InlB B-repeat-containing protein, partial [Clostridia bacterium]